MALAFVLELRRGNLVDERERKASRVFHVFKYVMVLTVVS